MEATKERPTVVIAPGDDFSRRHIGSGLSDQSAMLKDLGQPSLDALIDNVVPLSIRLQKALNLPDGCTEAEALSELKKICVSF